MIHYSAHCGHCGLASLPALRLVNLNSTTTFDPNGNAPLLSGNLAGPGGMTLQANSGGTLALAGNNSFSGAVALNAGTLIVAHPNALGTTARA
jgi:fibronectin-binding autotransporter adhesin